jgi:hypothetical protein
MDSTPPSLDDIDVPEPPGGLFAPPRPATPPPAGLRRVKVPGGTRLEAEGNATFSALSHAIAAFEADASEFPTPTPAPAPRTPLRPAARRPLPGRPGVFAFDPADPLAEGVPVAAGDAALPTALELEEAAMERDRAVYGSSRFAGMSGPHRMRFISLMRVALRRLNDRKHVLIGNGARMRDKLVALHVKLHGEKEALTAAIFARAPAHVIARLQSAIKDLEGMVGVVNRDFDDNTSLLAATDIAINELSTTLALLGGPA